MRLTTLAVAALFGLAPLGVLNAAEDGPPLMEKAWPSEGVFGSFDRAKMQRGLQVYQNVCQACHGLKYVAFRNLEELGYEEPEIEAIAAQYSVTDGPDDTGEMFDREAVVSDRFPSPYPNDKAAAAANGGKAPPDLSLITKAREDGVDYVYSLLQGYPEEPPEDADVPDGSYYNEYYPGHVIAMPPILFDDAVEYADGTPATVEQMASDVAHFLTFTAEPKLEERKQTGVMAFLFLIVFTGIFWAYKRRIWADVKKH